MSVEVSIVNSFNIPTAAVPHILSELCRLICSVCSQKCMSCTFEFIGFSVGICECVWDYSFWVHSCRCMHCICAKHKYVFSFYTACKSSLSDTVYCISKASLSYTFPPLMNTQRCFPTSILTHILPSFSYTHTHMHEHTSPQLNPHSWQWCNNYCSLADGVLIAPIFH